jgi:hypothetical protein
MYIDVRPRHVWRFSVWNCYFSLLVCIGLAYMGERAWKALGDRLQTPCYLRKGDHDKKLGAESSGQISGNTPL